MIYISFVMGRHGECTPHESRHGISVVSLTLNDGKLYFFFLFQETIQGATGLLVTWKGFNRIYFFTTY
jgi:hypothetical protein